MRAYQVDLHRLGEHVGVVLVASARQVRSRVVDQYVERAEFGIDETGQIIDVAGLGHPTAAVGPRNRRVVVGRARAGPGDDELSAGLGEGERQRGADATPGTGDEHVLPR